MILMAHFLQVYCYIIICSLILNFVLCILFLVGPITIPLFLFFKKIIFQIEIGDICI